MLPTGGKGGPAHSTVVLQIVGWGCVAECLTSVCCPLVHYGELNVTSTMLNVVGPMFAGAVYSLEESAIDPLLRQLCRSFQSGFISVVTSFAFTIEQASLLWSSRAHGPSQAVVYVLASIVAGCAGFSAGHSVVGCLLSTHCSYCRTAVAPTPARSLQWLWGVVGLVWAYVLLTPAGTVYEPLDLVGEATDREPTGDDGSPSKLVDVKHLACGLLLQTAGLLSALRLSGGQGTVSPPWSWVAWAPLKCNGATCALLLLLHSAEVNGLQAPDALIVLKMRTSGCGALSASGGLAAALVALARSSGRIWHAVLNFALHAYLACSTIYAMKVIDLVLSDNRRTW